MIRFADVNQVNSRDYRPNYQRHHLIPVQSTHLPELVEMFTLLSDDGFSLDDFSRNGILLPSCEREAAKTGRPLHRGPHPRYNLIVIRYLLRIHALSNGLDDHLDRLRFISFRIGLLQDSLKQGLDSSFFERLRLNSRDPLRPDADFDVLDNRIQQLCKEKHKIKVDRAKFALSCSHANIDCYASEL